MRQRVSRPQLKRIPLGRTNPNPDRPVNLLVVRFGKLPAVGVVAMSALWVVGAVVVPLLWGMSQGAGVYWGLSWAEIRDSLPLLIVPPAILVGTWHVARRLSGR